MKRKIFQEKDKDPKIVTWGILAWADLKPCIFSIVKVSAICSGLSGVNCVSYEIKTNLSAGMLSLVFFSQRCNTDHGTFTLCIKYMPVGFQTLRPERNREVQPEEEAGEGQEVLPCCC
jgi:hypothetical protein